MSDAKYASLTVSVVFLLVRGLGYKGCSIYSEVDGLNQILSKHEHLSVWYIDAYIVHWYVTYRQSCLKR